MRLSTVGDRAVPVSAAHDIVCNELLQSSEDSPFQSLLSRLSVVPIASIILQFYRFRYLLARLM